MSPSKHEPVEAVSLASGPFEQPLNGTALSDRLLFGIRFLPLFAPLKSIYHPSPVTKDLLRNRSTEYGWIWPSEAKGVSCGSYPV